jgi:hypothetical protein
LEEEIESDLKLTEIAEEVNVEASDEGEEEDDDADGEEAQSEVETGSNKKNNNVAKRKLKRAS